MMLYFDKEEMEKILAGKKTATRYLHHNGDMAEAISHGHGIKDYTGLLMDGSEWLYKGQTYGISLGSGESAVAQVYIQGIEREDLHDIAVWGALREGMLEESETPPIEQFKAWWDSKHPGEKERWAKNPTVWRIHFRLVKTDEPMP